MFKKKFIKKDENIYVFDYSEVTAKRVNEFYKANPFPNYEVSDNKGTIASKGNSNFYVSNLKKFIGFNKKVLEVGAGTSQLSNYLAIGNNNSVVAFDLNIEALKIGSLFAKENKIKNVNFVCGDVFDDIFKENIFDIVLCNGVLHHTKNSFDSFKHALKWVNKNGFIIVGLYNKYGRLRTLVRKYIYKILGRKYLMLFDPVLRKISKDSTDKINAWIKDQYLHPVERTHSFDEVLKWFDMCDVEFINSIPRCEFIKDSSHEELYVDFFKSGKRGNFVERILIQLSMIFTRPGSEGGLYLVLGKKR